jgi:hypothetical protein
MLGESNSLQVALGNLAKRKDQLEKDLLSVRELQYREREKERLV